jgi:phage gp16-like protein
MDTPAIVRDPRRRTELTMIHVAKKDLCLADESYRAILLRLTGKESAGDLTAQERDAVLAHFRSLGWAYKAKAPKRAGGRPLADSAVALKARALWLSLYELAAIDDASESALAAFAKRQVGVDDLRWLKPDEAFKLIEALKKWCAREGYAPDERTLLDRLPADQRMQPDAQTRAYQCALIDAQWNKLVKLGAFAVGSMARHDTWLARSYGVSAPFFLDNGQLRNCVEKMGQWVRRFKAMKDQKSAVSA